MDTLLSQCASHSVGPANQLFGLLIQTLLAAQCSISPADKWPIDYGPTAIEKGIPNIRGCALVHFLIDTLLNSLF